MSLIHLNKLSNGVQTNRNGPDTVLLVDKMVLNFSPDVSVSTSARGTTMVPVKMKWSDAEIKRLPTHLFRLFVFLWKVAGVSVEEYRVTKTHFISNFEHFMEWLKWIKAWKLYGVWSKSCASDQILNLLSFLSWLICCYPKASPQQAKINMLIFICIFYAFI